MTDQTTPTEATAPAPGRPLRPSELEKPQEYGSEPREQHPGHNGHVSRSFSRPDPFTADCPCEVAACGFAIVSENDCPQHALTSTKTIRHFHSAADCPRNRS